MLFFGFAHHHVITCAPIQTYTKYHMITELVEPRITANIFLHVCGGVWERDYQGFIQWGDRGEAPPPPPRF